MPVVNVETASGFDYTEWKSWKISELQDGND
jgi:hypothetical protein